MFFSLIVIATLGSAPDATAQVEAVWKPLKPVEKPTSRPSGWSWRLTPALPAEWPPKSNAATVIRYAFAAAQDPLIRDGEPTTPPFASIEIAPDDSVKVTALTKSLGATQIQGFKPITKDEADRLSADLLEPARAGQMSNLRVSWCLWLKYNGVVGAQLKAKHAAFFDALDCSSVKSSK
ncbi:MAG: hypothetical protein QM817_10065 [Archangium sp.]